MKRALRIPSVALAFAVLCAAVPSPVATMQAQGIPGMEMVVVSHGRVVTDAAYGVKNVDTQQPVDVHTRFEIGSITKQFTAAAILQLREQGRLSLDDRLGKYVPQYVPGRNVTLRQLLWQVSGIPNYTSTAGFRNMISLQGTTIVLGRRGNFNAMLALIRGLPLHFRPGTQWRYSNTNYVLLGRVVEIASGMSWEQYVRTHIFAPAGMHESSFMSDESHIADMATGYMMYHGHVRPTSNFIGWAFSAGAIVSTASDLAKWDAALFGGKLVSAADLRLMTTGGPLPAGGANEHYGFGWVVDRYDGQPRIWHNGGTLGFSASNQIYPRQHQAVIVLVNQAGGAADTIADATWSGLHPRLAAAANARAPGENPVVTARAKAVLAQFMSGNLDRSQFDASMNAAMTPAVVAGAKAQFAPLGAPVSWVYRGKRVAGGTTTYAYRVTFQNGTQLNVYMSIDAQGKIAGYLLSPS
jgi:D-alanyl-D-alanine carboxypeptidase